MFSTSLFSYKPHPCSYLATFYWEIRFSICRCFRKIAKSDYWLRRVSPSVRPHGTTRLPLDVFSWNFIFEYFAKIYREDSNFHVSLTRAVSALREDIYTFLSCLAHFLAWNISDKSYVYWTVHHLDSWVKRDQLDVTCFIISLLNA